MSAPEQPDTDAEPLTDTGEAVVGTDEAVVETGDAVVETDTAVVETSGRRGRDPRRNRAARPEDQGVSAVPAVEDEKPRMDLSQLKAIVEALVFASPEPLTPKMLLKLLNDEPKEDVLAAVEALKQRLRRPGPGCTWRKSPAVIRSPPGPSCTTGCGGCSTSGPRRSSRWPRSRRCR